MAEEAVELILNYKFDYDVAKFSGSLEFSDGTSISTDSFGSTLDTMWRLAFFTSRPLPPTNSMGSRRGVEYYDLYVWRHSQEYKSMQIIKQRKQRELQQCRIEGPRIAASLGLRF